MVRKKFRTQVLVSVVLGVFLKVSPAFAFFLGNIDIKSQFGENFEASFEIHLDNDRGYEVALGDQDDYEKLGLTRPSLMDFLTLEKPTNAATETKQFVRIFSKVPLFFPSFNLVVLAKHNGGTLLENFLVTVDFKQGLALNGLGKKKKKSASVKSQTEKREVLTTPMEAERRTLAKPPATKKEVRSEERKVSSPVQDKELPVKDVLKLPQKPEVDKVSPKKSLAINPTPVVKHLQNRRRLTGAIWAAPKKIFPVGRMSILSASSEKEGEKQKEPVVSQVRDTIQLESGEGLFSVARKIKIKEIHPARVAVALWMRNIDKFIYGNIHGIQVGTQLEKEGVEKLAAKIDLRTAKSILNSQAQEWKITKEKANEVEELKPNIQEVPLPVERIDRVASIFEWVPGWKSSWEEDDIGRHISFYHEKLEENSKQTSDLANSIQKRKKKLFLKYPNPVLKLSSQNLVSKQGRAWVVFEQHFNSKSMESFGTKEIRVVWKNGSWKIDKEKFYEEKHEVTQAIRQKKEKAKKGRPFVIHVSTHSKKTKAIFVSNELRKIGYDAYSAPVRVSKGINIYRVYIGRFATWDQAQRIVKILRGEKHAGHATAIPYPFTLRVGEVSTVVEARQLLEKLRVKGVSGLLSITNNGLEVYVGAFKKPENAIWLKQKLKESGFGFQQISP